MKRGFVSRAYIRFSFQVSHSEMFIGDLAEYGLQPITSRRCRAAFLNNSDLKSWN